MLKKFFLNFLSSFAAVWVALGLFFLTAIIVVIALIGKMGMNDASVEKLKRHSIMTHVMYGEIEETSGPVELDYMKLVTGDIERPQTLDVLVSAIREAADNKNVDMIYLKCKDVAAAPATLNALRDELQKFRKSGKKIYAYGDNYSLGTYYVASVADKVYVNPEGSISIKGLGGTTLFMKDLFDKLGVTFEVVKVGTFKSAVEPYILNEMSEPARAQLDTLYGDMWKYICNGIGEQRKIAATQIDTLINKEHLMLQNGSYDVKCKLADEAVYERQMDEILAKAIDVDKKDLNFVSPAPLAAMSNAMNSFGAKRQIAVLYATGEIAEGTSNGIKCEALVPVIVELADDDNVKGMVLRVNSPGGSVFGSEQIGEALDYFKSTGKPLAVSMGDYAASGGYWISCGADRIFADPLTITGSIGIFGLIPNIEELAHNIGVNPQTVSTNPSANFPSFFTKMTPEQHAAMQKYIEEGYDRFIDRVAKGRKMSPEKVRQIAEGRVWTAPTALKIGLIDELGQLEDACEWVKEKVSSEKKLDIVIYPRFEPGFLEMLQSAGQSAMMKMLSDNIMKMSADAVLGQMAVNVLTRKPAQARMVNISFSY